MSSYKKIDEYNTEVTNKLAEHYKQILKLSNVF